MLWVRKGGALFLAPESESSWKKYREPREETTSGNALWFSKDGVVGRKMASNHFGLKSFVYNIVIIMFFVWLLKEKGGFKRHVQDHFAILLKNVSSPRSRSFKQAFGNLYFGSGSFLD